MNPYRSNSNIEIQYTHYHGTCLPTHLNNDDISCLPNGIKNEKDTKRFERFNMSCNKLSVSLEHRIC